MDWADDVAYSVHDLEDGLQSGMITLAALRDGAERRAVTELTAATYCEPGSVTAGELGEVFASLLSLPAWPVDFDGGPASLAALKHLTSELISRFCDAAQDATLTAAGLRAGLRGRLTGADGWLEKGAGRSGAGGRRRRAPARGAGGAVGLTRYAADLVVPRRQRLECALLKGVTARYVMNRPGVTAAQASQRELITELAAAVRAGAPGALDPVFRPGYAEAGSAAQRLRVVVDQIASLTDTSAIAWHRRLCQ